ncbi:helix-turn-helix domain-containing protein [Streptomyces sp. NPDC004051]
MTRGNVSNHLSCLRGCGLVCTVPVGRRVRYALADPKLADAFADLAALVLLVDEEGPADRVCAPDDYSCPADEGSEEALHG